MADSTHTLVSRYIWYIKRGYEHEDRQQIKRVCARNERGTRVRNNGARNNMYIYP